MSSFQQIAMGAGCLLAAFAFGSYINHTAPEDPARAQIGSRLPLDDLEVQVAQGEEMPRMQARAKPLLTLTELPESSSSESLPPPSQLAAPRGGQAAPQTAAPLADAATSADPDSAETVPDFAAIAAEFQDTPLRLSAGEMPRLERPEPPSLKQMVVQPGKVSDTPLETVPDFFGDESSGAGRVVDPGQEAAPRGRISAVEPLRDASAGLPADDTNSGMGSILELTHQPTSPVATQSPAEVPSQSGVEAPAGAVYPADRVVSRNGDLGQVVSGQPQVREPVTPLPAPPRQAVGRIPFTLTPQAKTELARLRDQAANKISLETTEFTHHQVQPGETLQSISARFLGRPDYYLDIYLANREQCRNPGDLRAGMTLKIPVYRAEGGLGRN